MGHISISLLTPPFIHSVDQLPLEDTTRLTSEIFVRVGGNIRRETLL